MRVAQVIFGIGVVNAAGQRRFIAAAGPDALTFFTHDDRGTGILAGRQHAFRRNFRIAQELQGDVFVVFAGFRVEQD
ncbi:Uncharacterised protein [Raoultella ornithinolytica]|nr:Uncharacterised protein [Raoultella ornithinolytica]